MRMRFVELPVCSRVGGYDWERVPLTPARVDFEFPIENHGRAHAFQGVLDSILECDICGSSRRDHTVLSNGCNYPGRIRDTQYRNSKNPSGTCFHHVRTTGCDAVAHGGGDVSAPGHQYKKDHPRERGHGVHPLLPQSARARASLLRTTLKSGNCIVQTSLIGSWSNAWMLVDY